ncbi:hypothetical protein JOD82_000242 [Paenibacillus sp. 1182]|nr:hypothetical protein [Paenibacillus sp. 1182]
MLGSVQNFVQIVPKFKNKPTKYRLKLLFFRFFLYAPKRIVMPYILFYTEFIGNDNTKYEVQPHDELFR